MASTGNCANRVARVGSNPQKPTANVKVRRCDRKEREVIFRTRVKPRQTQGTETKRGNPNQSKPSGKATDQTILTAGAKCTAWLGKSESGSVQPGRKPILDQPGGTDYSVALDLVLVNTGRLMRNRTLRRFETESTPRKETFEAENWTTVRKSWRHSRRNEPSAQGRFRHPMVGERHAKRETSGPTTIGTDPN